MCSLKATAPPKISERYASIQSEGEKHDALGVQMGGKWQEPPERTGDRYGDDSMHSIGCFWKEKENVRGHMEV